VADVHYNSIKLFGRYPGFGITARTDAIRAKQVFGKGLHCGRSSLSKRLNIERKTRPEKQTKIREILLLLKKICYCLRLKSPFNRRATLLT